MGHSPQLVQCMFQDKINIEKYLTIPYVHLGRDFNGIDCYGLLKLFYQEEFNIDLPDYSYEQDWHSKGLSLIQEQYWKCFRKIEEPIKYCAVGFTTLARRGMTHIGIMLDQLRFLHVPRNQSVCVSKTTDRYWGKVLFGFYAVKDFRKWQN